MYVDKHNQMQLHAELLIEDMAQLLYNLEDRSQEQSRVVPGALLFTALQQWHLQALAGLLGRGGWS